MGLNEYQIVGALFSILALSTLTGLALGISLRIFRSFLSR